jgi:hypothetical protein
LIEKNGGSGRRSSTKADGGVVQEKSRVGQSPPVACGGHEVGGVGRAHATREKERKGGTVATTAFLNRRAEVGDGRRGGAMRQVRAKREGVGPGRCAWQLRRLSGGPDAQCRGGGSNGI